LNAADARDAYDLTFHEALAEAAVAAEPPLADFGRHKHEESRARYRQIDKRLQELNRREVAHLAAKVEVPAGVSTGRVAELTELGLIKHEVGKQRAHVRIRQLFGRASAAVMALKPCLMMSPMSVAQFLPPGLVEFDIVIMDEASQIRPEEALGAAARGRQLVVVGDPKQLPPTSFFDRMDAGEIEEEEEAGIAEDAESVLEVAMRGLATVRRLKGHYRSLHESLIAFSNDRFYDGELVVFPSPVKEAARLGVFRREVAGTYQPRVGSLAEAQAVAEAIAEHARQTPHWSLGVGVFNMRQRDLIIDALDRLMEQDAGLRTAVTKLEEQSGQELFIKNLENLQGDERDVIFIGYTFGPDEASGRVFQRFGPVTGEHGWRRLNVLITRARRRVEVFSTMNPSQILAGPDKSRGVNAMKDYLAFAADGTLPTRTLATGKAPDSPFEVAVARVVRSMGLDVRPQVGVAGYFIDIGVLKPGREDEYLLGIECDGATYHSARSVRDRDRLRQQVIESRGWKLHRVWSTDWFFNQQSEERRLREAITAALAG
ncbi:MAG: AAA domain-containing protein, partial [Phycisphaerae bacterium]